RAVLVVRPAVAWLVGREHRHEQGGRIAVGHAGFRNAGIGGRVVDVVGPGPRLDATLPARIGPERFLVVARLAPMAGLAGAVSAVAGTDIFGAGRNPFARVDLLHVLVQREARQHGIGVLAPAGAALVPDSVHLLCVTVGIGQRRPVEILVVDR